MATPIKITPPLRGKASARFNRLLNAQKDEKVSKEEKGRLVSLVNKVLSNSKLASK
jgi:hypothetical protein